MEKRGDIIPVMRCRRDDPGAIYLGTRTGSQDPPRDNPGTSFGPGTSRYCLFYWSVTPIFFLFFFFRSDRRKKGDRFKGARLREKGEGRKREKGEEEGKRKKKKEIVGAGCLGVRGSEFRIGGGARACEDPCGGGGRVAAINETDCRNDRTLGRDSVDKYMPGVLWKLLLAAQHEG